MKEDFENVITERAIIAIKMLKSLKKVHSNLEICTKCNVNQNYISDVFKHKHNVSLQFIEMLIYRFDISRKYIYEGRGGIFAGDEATSQSEQSQPSSVQSAPQVQAMNEDTVSEVTALRSEIELLKEQNAALIKTNAMLAQMLSQKEDGMAVCTRAGAASK